MRKETDCTEGWRDDGDSITVANALRHQHWPIHYRFSVPTRRSCAPDGKQMSAQGDSIAIGFDQARSRKKRLAIARVVPQFGPEPARALNPEDPDNVQARIAELILQVSGTMEERRGEPSRLLIGVAVLSFGKVALHNRAKPGVENEAKPNTIHHRCQARDTSSRDEPSRANNPLRLAQCLKAVFSLNQVVERTQQQRGVKAPIPRRKLTSISNLGSKGTAMLLRKSASLLYMERRDVHQVCPVTQFRKPS